MKEHENEIIRLGTLISDLIRNNYNPHTTVVISDNYVKLVADEFGAPTVSEYTGNDS